MEKNLMEESEVIYSNIEQVYDLAEDKVQSDLNVAREIFGSYGSPTIINGEMIIIDDEGQRHTVNDNFEIVDKIKSLVGGTATIFQLKDFEGVRPGDQTTNGWSYNDAMYRVSTNVVKLDGNRAVGTIVSKPVYDTIMKGESFYGRAFVVNAWYMTAYEPIRDQQGNIIGILYVGVKEDEFKDVVIGSLKDIDVGDTGSVWILDSEGTHVLSKDGLYDGVNVWDEKDEDGEYFFQSIINDAIGNAQGTAGFAYYPWEDETDDSVKEKLAAYVYFEPWDWIIAPSAYVEDFTKNLDRIRNSAMILAVISIALGISVAYYFSKNFIDKFNKVVEGVDRLSKGDLSMDKAQIKGSNEFAKLFTSFNAMVDNLKGMIRSIIENSNIAASTAEELSAASQETNASTEQVSATIQEIAKGSQKLSASSNDSKKAIGQLVSSINMVANSAQESSKKSSEARNVAKTGEDSAKVAGDKMKSISNVVNSSSAQIQELGVKTEEINKIIEVINGISEQTNLLALNAAIEAARAGEAGKGFAVVADEVRKLAEESKNATKQIESMINDITGSIKSSVESMQKGTVEVEEGSTVVNQALESLEKIAKQIEGVASDAEMIGASTQIQKDSSQKVITSIEDLNSIAEESAASTEEVSASIEEISGSVQQVASSAQNLAKSAEELKLVVNKFKIE